MIGMRFRANPEEGNCLTVSHLTNVELAGFKHSQVRQFLAQFRYVLQHIPATERNDKKMMYQWLYRKFRTWPLLKNKMEMVEDQPRNSPFRTWDWLWLSLIHI